MVDVDVNVEHPLMHLEQLQDGDHDVVDVTEAGRLELLGVVEDAGPVHGDLAATVVQLVWRKKRNGFKRELTSVYAANQLEMIDWGFTGSLK